MMIIRSSVAAVTLAVTLCHGQAAMAHVVDPLEAAPSTAPAGAVVEQLRGEVRNLEIDDRIAGIVFRHRSLVTADGAAVRLLGESTARLESGNRVEVVGRRNGRTLFADAVRLIAPAAKAKPAHPGKKQAIGELRLIHIDYFDANASEFQFEVVEPDGKVTPLKLPVIPEALQRGM